MRLAARTMVDGQRPSSVAMAYPKGIAMTIQSHNEYSATINDSSVLEPEEFFIVEDGDETLADPRDFQDAELPGLPPPLAGDRLKALVDDIAQNGLLHPIYVGRESRLVYAGRSRLRACAQLGKQVRVIFIEDQAGIDKAWATALTRDMTLVEKARLARFAFENMAWLNQIGGKLKGEKLRDTFGRWLRTRRGWTSDTSGRQVDYLLRLAEALEQHPGAEAGLVDVVSPKTALAMLQNEPKAKPSHERRLLCAVKRIAMEMQFVENLSGETKASAIAALEEALAKLRTCEAA